MHICFISSEFPKHGYPHGGVGSFIASLGKALVAKGVEVSVIGLGYDNKAEAIVVDGIHVYRVSRKKVKGLQWWMNAKAINQKIKEVHQKQAIDIIETPELGLAFLQKIKGIKYIIRMHGGHHYFAHSEKRPLEQWKAFQEKRSFKKADECIAVSDYVGTQTQQLIPDIKFDFTTIYNSIDTHKFYQSDIDKIKKHSIFFAGSLVEKKGIRQLVQSLNYLIDKFPDVHLYIAGRDGNMPGTKIPFRPILEAEINEKIKPHITFLGVLPHEKVADYIECSEVCCYPSHMEAMPMAWLEVLAMGKVFVGSKTGPGSEAVIDNKTGLLCNPHNPKDIAEKIKWIFENPEKAKEIGQQARKSVMEKFNIETIVEQNIEFYKTIIQ